MAVASKIKDDQVTIIDDLKFSAPKTRDMATLIKAVKCHAASLLVATAAADANVYKSARNIEGVSVSPVAELNALTVLKPRRLLFTKAALDWIKEQAGKSAGGSKAAAEPAQAKPRKKKAAS
jgi:large subunit ribosomal protein L4